MRPSQLHAHAGHPHAGHLVMPPRPARLILKSGFHPPPCQVRAIRLKAQGPTSRTRYSAEVQQRALTAASLYNHQQPELAGTRVKHPEPPLVRDEEARHID